MKEFSEGNLTGAKLSFRNINRKEEGYSLNYAGGEFTLIGENVQSLVFGISVLKAATLSGHVSEFLGDHKPKTSLRPLWIKGLPLTKMQTICERLLLLGYNSVVLEVDQTEFHSLSNLVATCKEYGIKVILKPSVTIQDSFMDSKFSEGLQLNLKPLFEPALSIDYLFWESSLLKPNNMSHPKMRELLEGDAAILEVKLLEKFLRGKSQLIYSIQTPDKESAEKQNKWIFKLLQSCSMNTIVAFSPYAGKPWEEHLSLNPIWNTLRSVNRISKMNLLPIFNIGHISQGDGFWPILPLETINRFIPGLDPHRFSGAVMVTPHIPKEDALLSCGLWTAAQTLWGLATPHLLTETWLAAFAPQLAERGDAVPFMQDCRNIAVQLGALYTLIKENKPGISKDEYRSLTDSLLAQLRNLQMRLDQKNGNQNQPSLYDRFAVFARDARKLILHFLQHYHLPVVNVLQEEDMQDSFWAEAGFAGAQGKMAGVKINLRKQPFEGKPGSPMAKIFQEVVD